MQCWMRFGGAGVGFLLAVVLGTSCVSQKVSEASPSSFDFKPVGSTPSRSSRRSPSTSPAASAPAAAALRSSQTFTNRNEVITLINPLVGRVVTLNRSLRFVVLDFSLNRLPSVDQRLSVYRQGQKVGEVKVSGPELDGNIVADLVAGEAQPGDEVRDN